MNEKVLDASILLAILKGEPAADILLEIVDGAVMSAVNLAEVYAKLADFGIGEGAAFRPLIALLDRVEHFSLDQARLTGHLRSSTRSFGLSLGDRACLALALELRAEVYTMDRAWAKIDAGCAIHIMR